MKQSASNKLVSILEAKEQLKYQEFLKAFDEVCIVNENNQWIGVINPKEEYHLENKSNKD